MARTHKKPAAREERVLEPAALACLECAHRTRMAYHSRRRLLTLEGPLDLVLPVRACQNPACGAYKRPVRPPEEGRLALPQAECGLDLVAYVGACRYQQHRSVPEIHARLKARDVGVCERTVTNLLARYEELVALRLADSQRLRRILTAQGRVVLALDGLQPDVGHEVLWLVRDLLSGEVLLAKSLLSASTADLSGLLTQVRDALPVPVVGVISDAQIPIRAAVAQVFPQAPHQLCQFHYLREAARPINEADRHAKKELKKYVRGIRPLERGLEGGNDPESEAASAYCQAVRSAITDDGPAPLSASGTHLRRRLQAIATSLERVQAKGGRSLD